MIIYRRLTAATGRTVALALGMVAVAAVTLAWSQSGAEWNKVVAAGKAEGKLVISHFTDAGLEPILKKFTAKFGHPKASDRTEKRPLHLGYLDSPGK